MRELSWAARFRSLRRHYPDQVLRVTGPLALNAANGTWHLSLDSRHPQEQRAWWSDRKDGSSLDWVGGSSVALMEVGEAPVQAIAVTR